MKVNGPERSIKTWIVRTFLTLTHSKQWLQGKNFIMSFSDNVVARTIEKSYETQGNDLEVSYGICSSLEERRLLATTTNLLGVALKL